MLGVVGGVLNLPFALCSGACTAGLTADETVGNTYMGMGLAAGAIAIIFACFAKKSPVLAGIMLLVSTFLSGVCYGFSFNIMGFVSTILTLIGGILCFTQKKEFIEPEN